MPTPTSTRLQLSAAHAYHEWQTVAIEAQLTPIPPHLTDEVTRLVRLHHREYLAACRRFSDECKRTGWGHQKGSR